MSKLKKIPYILIASFISSCNQITPLNDSLFETKALSNNYLDFKVRNLISKNDSGKSLVREIEFSRLKNPNLMKSVFLADCTLYAQVIGSNKSLVLQKRSIDPAFSQYLSELECNNNPSSNFTGDEFIVNTSVVNSQAKTVVALSDDSSFVVAWEGIGDDPFESDINNNKAIYARRYNSVGQPISSEFLVNTWTNGKQSKPSIAMDSSGNFIITWESYGQTGIPVSNIYGQRYNSSGVSQGSEFKISDNDIAGQDVNAKVTMDNSGNFAVVWGEKERSQLTTTKDIFVRIYNSIGNPQSSSFLVNTHTTDNQFEPSISMDNDGDFVVTWQSNSQEGNSSAGIYAQRYNSSGVPQGSEFLVNTYTTNNQTGSSVTLDGNGNFVIAWQSYEQDQDPSSWNIYAQRYNSSGVSQGTEFLVNTYTSSSQHIVSASSDNLGNFMIAWTSGLQDGDLTGVYTQKYNSNGTLNGSEFRVNSYTLGFQTSSSLSMNSSGSFILSFVSTYNLASSIYIRK